MAKDLWGKAALAPIEPAVKATLEMNAVDKIVAYVEATPHPLSLRHSFYSRLDQTYLPGTVGAAKVNYEW